jgi:hypothetical protein
MILMAGSAAGAVIERHGIGRESRWGAEALRNAITNGYTRDARALAF